MNLVDDPWIPAVCAGRVRMVSLIALFEEGASISDLALPTIEKISVLKLLICITHAAIDGPRNHEDWMSSLACIPASAVKYLEKWRQSFHLLGSRAFLQMDNLSHARESGKKKDAEKTWVAKLSLSRRCGSNKVIHDNSAFCRTPQNPAKLAIDLLTYQNFCVGGTCSEVVWNGSVLPCSGDKSPASSDCPMYIFVHTGNIITTIHANLTNKEQMAMQGVRWGCPVWENPPQSIADDEWLRTYLGRIVPMQQTVKIDKNCYDIILGAGFKKSKICEPWLSYYIGNDEKIKTLPVKMDKAPWRVLPSIVAVNAAKTNHGALVLDNHRDQKNIDIWIGGLVTNQSRIVGEVESSIFLDKKIIDDRELSDYADGVRHAEDVMSKMRDAYRVYIDGVSSRTLPRSKAKAFKKIVDGMTLKYWASVDGFSDLLLKSVAGDLPRSLNKKNVSYIVWLQTAWGKECRSAAIDILSKYCHRSSGLQIMAYMEAIGIFNGENKSGKKDKSTMNCHESAREYISHLQQYAEDKGVCAMLRKMRSETTRHYAWPYLGRFLREDNVRAYEVIGAIWAIKPSKDATVGNDSLAAAMKKTTHSYTCQSNRLRRLLSCDRDELVTSIYPICKNLITHDVRVDVVRLLSDIIYWGEDVKLRWARDFWGGEK